MAANYRPNVISGFESVQGRRWNMEDTHVAIDNLRETFPSLPDNKHYSFHAVYDGHGGKETAQIAEEYLHKNLVADPNFAANNYEAALTAAFERTDTFLRAQSEALGWRNGSTAVCSLIVDSTLYIANVGDSEGVLAQKGKNGLEAILLTEIHRPTKDSERQRVEEAGGHVLFGRINGSLAVSRALGDIDFKQPHNKSGGNWVIATPFIKTIQLTEDDEFVVIACDGLWDRLTYQDAVDLVAKARKTGKNPLEAADIIVKESLVRGSLDNITAIVIYLK